MRVTGSSWKAQRKVWIGAMIGSVVLVSGAQLAVADDAPATPAAESTAESTSVLTDLQKNFTVAYWGNYNGPGLTNATYNPNPDGTPGVGQYLDSLLTPSYKFSDNFLLGPAIEFYARPVISPDMTMLDLSLRFQAKNVINTDHWNLKLEGWAYAPTTGKSQLQNMLTGAKFVQSLNYTNGPLTAGVYAYERQYFFNGPGTFEDRRFYAAPNASYAIGKNVQATVWIDAWQYLHARGDAGFMPINTAWDVEPGINWDITPNFSLNPYLNIYPGSATLASTYIGLIIIGRPL